MKEIKKTQLLFTFLVWALILAGCNSHSNVNVTADLSTPHIAETTIPTMTKYVKVTTTPQYTSTVTILPKETSSPSKTSVVINSPDWIVENIDELYLCISPNENDERYLAIINPTSQETFFLPVREKDIKGFFWLAEPDHGIGWVNQSFDEYSILDFSTGKLELYPISTDSEIFITHAFSGINEPSNFSEHAYPLKMIAANNGEVYFIRQDVNDQGYDYSKNLSPDERFYIFEVWGKEHDLGDTTQIKGYDFQEQREISYEIPDKLMRPSVVNWLPNSNTLVEIGDYIIDMSTGSIVQELPESGVRVWHSNGADSFYNPISMETYAHSESGLGIEINVFNRNTLNLAKLDAPTEYFQYHDTFDLQNEILYNLLYIPPLDALGFSYFGFGSFEENEISSAGGYCLISLETEEINCITDAIEEMLIVVDEAANYIVRERVVYAQWSNSNRFIAFYLQRADDPPRLLMYDLESGPYFFVNNRYIDSPLGVWSP